MPAYAYTQVYAELDSKSEISISLNKAAPSDSTIVVMVGGHGGAATLITVEGGGLSFKQDVLRKHTTVNQIGGVFSAPAPTGLAAGTAIKARFNPQPSAQTMRAIAVYYLTGVHLPDPLMSAGYQQQTPTAAWSTAGITTNFRGSLSLAMSMLRDGGGTIFTSTPPAGWTKTGEVAAAGQSITFEHTTGENTGLGAYGGAGTWSGTPPGGTSQLSLGAVYKPASKPNVIDAGPGVQSSDPTVLVPWPTGVPIVDGDLMVVHLAWNYEAQIGFVDGWLPSNILVSGNLRSGYIWRSIDGTEDLSEPLPVPTGMDAMKVARMYHIRGASTEQPLVGVSERLGTSTTMDFGSYTVPADYKKRLLMVLSATSPIAGAGNPTNETGVELKDTYEYLAAPMMLRTDLSPLNNNAASTDFYFGTVTIASVDWATHAIAIQPATFVEPAAGGISGPYTRYGYATSGSRFFPSVITGHTLRSFRFPFFSGGRVTGNVRMPFNLNIPEPLLPEEDPAYVCSTVGADLHYAMQPLMHRDVELGNPLRTYLCALAAMIQEIDDYCRDNGSYPGWSMFMDLNRTPVKALDWLAQMVGVQPASAKLTAAQKRSRILAREGFKRGTLAAMRAAAQVYMVGSKTLHIYERDSSAYHMTVISYTSETPDQAAVLEALISQKPAGIVLNYIVVPGQTWLQLRTNHPNWASVKTTYSNWDEVKRDQP